jgi:hypothetical protein
MTQRCLTSGTTLDRCDAADETSLRCNHGSAAGKMDDNNVLALARRALPPLLPALTMGRAQPGHDE